MGVALPARMSGLTESGLSSTPTPNSAHADNRGVEVVMRE